MAVETLVESASAGHQVAERNGDGLGGVVWKTYKDRVHTKRQVPGSRACSRTENKSGQMGMEGLGGFWVCSNDGVSSEWSWDGRRGSCKQAAIGRTQIKSGQSIMGDQRSNENCLPQCSVWPQVATSGSLVALGMFLGISGWHKGM